MFWQLMEDHLAPPPEREIGHCVTSMLVEEIERLTKREQHLSQLLQRVYEYENYVSKGTHPMLPEILEALSND